MEDFIEGCIADLFRTGELDMHSRFAGHPGAERSVKQALGLPLFGRE